MARGAISTYDDQGNIMTGRGKGALFNKRDEKRGEGYVILARRFFKCEDLNGPIERDLFAWMIAEARFKDGKKLRRGQLFTTRERIRQRTEIPAMNKYPGSIWTYGQVRGYLNRLTYAGMIKTKYRGKGLVISIVNYDEYQGRRWSDARGAENGREQDREQDREQVDADRISNDQGGLSDDDSPSRTGSRTGSRAGSSKTVPPPAENDPQKTAIGNDPGDLSPAGIREQVDGDEISNDPGDLIEWSDRSRAGSYKLEIMKSKNKEQKKKKKGKEKESDGPGSNLPAVIEKSPPVELEVVDPGGDFVPGPVSKNGIPYREILDAFLEHCPTLPRARMTKNLKDRIRARWNEDKEFRSLAFWREYFSQVNGSEFLTGDNDRGWTASLHWITGPENMGKVLAGNYVNRPRRMPRPTTYAQMQDAEQRIMNSPEGDEILWELYKKKKKERENYENN